MSFTTKLGYTPAFQITKDGADLASAFRDRVTSISVTSVDGNGESDKLDVVLDDRDWSIQVPATDGVDQATLSVYLGYTQTGLYEQGSFHIGEATMLGNPKSLRLHGTSMGFQSAIKTPLITSHDGQTLQSIVEAIADSGGFSAVVDPDLGSKAVAFLNQHSSSMHLLQELERRFNGLAKIQDGILSFTKQGAGTSASGQTLDVYEITPEDLGSWNFTIKDRTSYSGTKAGYFDKVAQQIRYVTNTTPATGKAAVPFLMRRLYPTQDEAQAAADAQMSALNRGIIRATITLAKGAPMIHGGAPVVVSECKTEMNGSYEVGQAVHTYTKEGGIATTLDVSNVDPGVDFQPALSEQDIFRSAGIDPDALRPVTTPAGSGGIGGA